MYKSLILLQRFIQNIEKKEEMFLFKFFANIFGYVLNFIYGMVNNYGVAIILFTILLKLIMLPISIKQQKTMKKSAKIQGQVKKIQEKYKNDPTRMNQEVMDLYKKENMSPFSGCLSSILQIVLVISMFYLVSRPLTYMKHVDTELIHQYTQELQEAEGAANYQEIGIIRTKASEDERVNINMDFLGLNLSSVPSQNYHDWKVFIIPVLYVITSFISTRITTNMNKTKKKEEEKPKVDPNTKELMKKEEENIDMMEEMNKNMMIMMPIMTVSIALIAPLGLALYWLINNIFMLGERLIINKLCKSEEE